MTPKLGNAMRQRDSNSYNSSQWHGECDGGQAKSHALCHAWPLMVMITIIVLVHLGGRLSHPSPEVRRLLGMAGEWISRRN